MKTPQVLRWMRNLMMGIIALLWISPTDSKADELAGVSFQVFYDELMPYGDWVKDARYGYVWLPAVQNDFHPYGTDGHWVNTAYGNTWVSDYDWGWAAFHYGRWYFDDNYQSWAWIPDYDWGPAWVDWRTGGGYYGWAPMGPGFSINIRLNIPSSYWVFVPQQRFTYANVYNYYVPRSRRVTIYNNTTIINNTIVYNNNRYYGGPARRDIERVTKQAYPERRIENSRAPGRTVASTSSVSSYRPDLQTSRATTVTARPSRTLSAGQSRTQPATSPSRVSSRSEAVSGRSTSTSAGSSRTSENVTTPSRTQNSGVRSTSPTSSRSTVETNPYSGSQKRSATPTVSRSSESRTSSPAVSTSRSSQTQTRTQSSTSSRTPTTRSSSTQATTSRATTSSPTVKSTPSRSTSTSKTSTSTSRSTPQVKSTSSSRTTTAKSSTSTSTATSRTSSSSSRGNNN